MKRQANAEWRGTLQDGTGTVSTGSRVLADTPYNFRSRFGEGKETNPEELVAAAHAACFSMALSAELGKASLTPEWIRTQATADFEKLDQGWTVQEMHLEVRAKVPGTDRGAFERAAESAKAGCPISRLLNTKISMSVTFEA